MDGRSSELKMTSKTEQTTIALSFEVLEAFREKMETQSTMNRQTGRLATESELIEGLMRFYIQGDIVLI